ncbi:early nodulin-like protein 1 [Panicum miliaceum]|uniref:Early nodulin-like protein 1 n=1 Tax=Panicum miliaceum TaxID=4540 RepID=A0A3L6QIS7_PANMI|nr:early nodulin-like protein 1 [Panicum miliaceum]
MAGPTMEPADYNARISSSYDKQFDDGSTTFTLDRARVFFISSAEDNCRANEKLIVMVAGPARRGVALADAVCASALERRRCQSAAFPLAQRTGSQELHDEDEEHWMMQRVKNAKRAQRRCNAQNRAREPRDLNNAFAAVADREYCMLIGAIAEAAVLAQQLPSNPQIQSQRNHSRNTRKCKRDNEVAVVERNPHGKKSGHNDLEYEKIMHKQCPIHPKSWHTHFECVTISKSIIAPPLPQAGKQKDKEDDEGGDKSGTQDFQNPNNVVNIIFGGDGGFASKRA